MGSSTIRLLTIISFCCCFLFSVQAEYLELTELLKDKTIRLEWNPLSETGNLLKNESTISFKIGTPFIVVNYQQKIGITAIIKENNRLLLTGETVQTITNIFNRHENLPQKERKVAAIILDPGHGGKDPGAVGKYQLPDSTLTIYEKDVVLSVAKKLEELLKKKYPAIRIILTRPDDRYIKLEARSEIANKIDIDPLDAILFISIHANSGFNKAATGFEVWHLPADYRRTLLYKEDASPEEAEIIPILNSMLEEEYLLESIRLADNILRQLAKQVGNLTENRGLREEAWSVVRKTNMPSILIELGFVSNQQEAVRLSQDTYLNKLALGIYNGINEFITSFENTKGFTE